MASMSITLASIRPWINMIIAAERARDAFAALSGEADDEADLLAKALTQAIEDVSIAPLALTDHRDPVERFADDRLIIRPGRADAIMAADIYAAYADWSRANRLPPLDPIRFHQHMTKRGFKRQLARGAIFYFGIRFRGQPS